MGGAFDLEDASCADDQTAVIQSILTGGETDGLVAVGGSDAGLVERQAFTFSDELIEILLVGGIHHDVVPEALAQVGRGLEDGEDLIDMVFVEAGLVIWVRSTSSAVMEGAGFSGAGAGSSFLPQPESIPMLMAAARVRASSLFIFFIKDVPFYFARYRDRFDAVYHNTKIPPRQEKYLPRGNCLQFVLNFRRNRSPTGGLLSGRIQSYPVSDSLLPRHRAAAPAA